jgi:DNA-binding HxlR family transcriptional regulator
VLRDACPSRGILARLGERWAMLILVSLRSGPLRFGQLQREVEVITKKMLTQALRRLERDGLVSRLTVRARPIAVEYRLTPRAHDVVPTVLALKEWAGRNWKDIAQSNDAFDACLAECRYQEESTGSAS